MIGVGDLVLESLARVFLRVGLIGYFPLGLDLLVGLVRENLGLFLGDPSSSLIGIKGTDSEGGVSPPKSLTTLRPFIPTLFFPILFS